MLELFRFSMYSIKHSVQKKGEKLKVNKVLVNDFFMEEGTLKKNGVFYPIKLSYYKTEEMNEDTKKAKYGIEIVKTEYIDDVAKIEVGRYYNLTYNEEIIDDVLNIFRKNEVTNIGAGDIVEDFFK